MVAAPDSAAGRKARCPHCAAVMDIPALATAVHDVAASASRPAHARVGETGVPAAGAAVATPPTAEQALTPPLAGLRAPTPRSNSSLSATRATTIDRLLGRRSPYKGLRLMGAVAFGLGATLAVLLFLGGLVSLILVSMAGNPLLGAGVFLGAIVVGGAVFLGARILNEMLSLWADLGDRMRQMTQLLEDSLARKDNGI